MILYIYEENQDTVLMEECAVYKSRKKIKELLEDLCLMYGSTLTGRRKAMAGRLMITQLVPVLISECTRDILFPIMNGNEGYWWLNFHAVERIEKLEKRTYRIAFYNGQSTEICCDARSLQRQMRRCELYMKILQRDTMEDYLKQLQIKEAAS